MYVPTLLETLETSLCVVRFFKVIRALGQTSCTWSGPTVKMTPLNFPVFAARVGVSRDTVRNANQNLQVRIPRRRRRWRRGKHIGDPWHFTQYSAPNPSEPGAIMATRMSCDYPRSPHLVFQTTTCLKIAIHQRPGASHDYRFEL